MNRRENKNEAEAAVGDNIGKCCWESIDLKKQPT
ncbi:unnamed protein product [Brassica rapa subsp. trilocularis]